MVSMPTHHRSPIEIGELTIPLERREDVLRSTHRNNVKDPCPVWDGTRWHMYCTGFLGSDGYWRILHFTGDRYYDPFSECEPILIPIRGACVAAPGVIFDTTDRNFHLFIQDDFQYCGGHIWHLNSPDGHTFSNPELALASLPGTNEAGIYDPHPAKINGLCFLVYTGFPESRHGDIFLAVSEKGWIGPWHRLGNILTHEQLPCHNQHDDPCYEWGLEGSQLIELPSRLILFMCVCFLRNAPDGCRQRLYFELRSDPLHSGIRLGTLPIRDNTHESRENGHGGLCISPDGCLVLAYQARGVDGAWKTCLALTSACNW